MPDPDMNGTPPAMAVVTETLRVAIDQATARRDQLAAELDEVRHELTSYTKALALIDKASMPTPTGKKPGPKPKEKSGTKIGPERLALIEQAIRDWVDEHGDVQFRQVDIRQGRPDITSSGTATAFAVLRDREVIRFAGKQGLNHYYRLTHAAIAEQQPV